MNAACIDLITDTDFVKLIDGLEGLNGAADRNAYWHLFLRLLTLRCASIKLCVDDNLWSSTTTFALLLNRLEYLCNLFELTPGTLLPVEHPQNEKHFYVLRARIDALNLHAQEPSQIFSKALYGFASAEGRTGADAVTPEVLASLMVDLASPAYGKVLDPCCGGGGLLMNAQRFARRQSSDTTLDLYGQESNVNTRFLARMNAIAHGIPADFGKAAADSLVSDEFPLLRADFVLANSPFNAPRHVSSDNMDDARWPFGVPPKNNQNFAWAQHCIGHLSDSGVAVVTLPNGSLNCQLKGEGKIRERIVLADLVDCIISLPRLPGNDSKILTSIWVFAKDKTGRVLKERSRVGETLFIDASAQSRRHPRLNAAESARIGDLYHAWKGSRARSSVSANSLRSRAVHIDEIVAQKFDLYPGRYIDPHFTESRNEPLTQDLEKINARLAIQFEESAKLDAEITARIRRVIDAV